MGLSYDLAEVFGLGDVTRDTAGNLDFALATGKLTPQQVMGGFMQRKQQDLAREDMRNKAAMARSQEQGAGNRSLLAMLGQLEMNQASVDAAREGHKLSYEKGMADIGGKRAAEGAKLQQDWLKTLLGEQSKEKLQRMKGENQLAVARQPKAKTLSEVEIPYIKAAQAAIDPKERQNLLAMGKQAKAAEAWHNDYLYPQYQAVKQRALALYGDPNQAFTAFSAVVNASNLGALEKKPEPPPTPQAKAGGGHGVVQLPHSMPLNVPFQSILDLFGGVHGTNWTGE